jgi:hypothetical protein
MIRTLSKETTSVITVVGNGCLNVILCCFTSLTDLGKSLIFSEIKNVVFKSCLFKSISNFSKVILDINEYNGTIGEIHDCIFEKICVECSSIGCFHVSVVGWFLFDNSSFVHIEVVDGESGLKSFLNIYILNLIFFVCWCSVYEGTSGLSFVYLQQ